MLPGQAQDWVKAAVEGVEVGVTVLWVAARVAAVEIEAVAVAVEHLEGLTMAPAASMSHQWVSTQVSYPKS